MIVVGRGTEDLKKGTWKEGRRGNEALLLFLR